MFPGLDNSDCNASYNVKQTRLHHVHFNESCIQILVHDQLQNTNIASTTVCYFI